MTRSPLVLVSVLAFVAGLALVAALAGCSARRSEPLTVRGAQAVLSVAVEPPTPVVGANALWLELRTPDGEPLAGADLEVAVVMPPMGAMAAMGGPATLRELGDGRYRAEFSLAMAGAWQIAISAQPAAGGAVRAEGSLTVGTPGLRLEGAGAAAAASPHAAPELPHPAEFRFEPERLQRFGVRTAVAERRPLERSLRALGRVVAEETRLEDVALKVRGFVGEVHADSLGAPVEEGEVLFTAYSPELYAAQEEYLQALRSRERARATSAPERSDALLRAARNRLRLWDVADAELERIARGGAPLEQLPIRARVSGYIVEKNVVEGSAFEAGERLYRIAPLAKVWVEAEVYEFELPGLREGQPATLRLAYLGQRDVEARVAYVYPTLDPATRTLRVRLEVANPDLALRPGMYANVHIQLERSERLVVPQSAVLHAGERSFVFRELGDGRFRPQAVELGLRSGEDVEVVSGLEAGDRIVSSGTFLVASESRLRAALEQW